MTTQDERIAALERATGQYRPVLQNLAYEMTMVKGLIITQTETTSELKEDVSEVKERLARMEAQLETILSLLRPS
jgi:predicted  nucleic acid-binding Zn-ribbon protein